VGFGAIQAGFGGVHILRPHVIPIESFSDIDVEFLLRFRVIDFVIARQIITGTAQLTRPRRHDVHNGRADALANPAPGVEIIQPLLPLIRLETRERLNHRLKKNKLRDLELFLLQLLPVAIDSGVRPEILQIPARGDNEFNAVEAQITNDFDGRLRVDTRRKVVETPTQAAHLWFAFGW
jgi:hypothetical protein